MRVRIEKLKAFADGYARAVASYDDTPHTDDWVVWGGYDINFVGSRYCESVNETDLHVFAYPEGWTGNLPNPIHIFTVVTQGESK
jgi:hypothetical protein